MRDLKGNRAASLNGRHKSRSKTASPSSAEASTRHLVCPGLRHFRRDIPYPDIARWGERGTGAKAGRKRRAEPTTRGDARTDGPDKPREPGGRGGPLGERRSARSETDRTSRKPALRVRPPGTGAKGRGPSAGRSCARSPAAPGYDPLQRSGDWPPNRPRLEVRRFLSQVSIQPKWRL